MDQEGSMKSGQTCRLMLGTSAPRQLLLGLLGMQHADVRLQLPSRGYCLGVGRIVVRILTSQHDDCGHQTTQMCCLQLAAVVWHLWGDVNTSRRHVAPGLTCVVQLCCRIGPGRPPWLMAQASRAMRIPPGGPIAMGRCPHRQMGCSLAVRQCAYAKHTAIQAPLTLVVPHISLALWFTPAV